MSPHHPASPKNAPEHDLLIDELRDILRAHWASALAGSMVPSGSLLMRPAWMALATAVWLTPRCWA